MNPTQLLQDLVRIPSVNPMGRAVSGSIYFEGRMTEYLENYFRNLGIRYQRQPVTPGRDNILAWYQGSGSCTYMFEVHQDTVPIEGMTIDPFGAELRDGKVWGRGACDIKGGMAAMLHAFTRLVKENPKGAASVILACTVDEECTFLGVQELAKQNWGVDYTIVAEPTECNIVDSHKGVAGWSIRTEGRACHASNPTLGVNAVYRMAKLVSVLEEYAAILPQRSSDPRLGSATISVGEIHGGVSPNTVPDQCVIQIDRRFLPHETCNQVQQDLENFLKNDPRIDFPFICDPIEKACPPFEPRHSGEITRRLGIAIDSVRGSHQVGSVPYGTDASTLSQAGWPVVVFGPGHIAQAHTKDEWVETSQLDLAAEILYQLATRQGDR